MSYEMSVLQAKKKKNIYKVWLTQTFKPRRFHVTVLKMSKICLEKIFLPLGKTPDRHVFSCKILLSNGIYDRTFRILPKAYGEIGQQDSLLFVWNRPYLGSRNQGGEMNQPPASQQHPCHVRINFDTLHVLQK